MAPHHIGVFQLLHGEGRGPRAGDVEDECAVPVLVARLRRHPMLIKETDFSTFLLNFIYVENDLSVIDGKQFCKRLK